MGAVQLDGSVEGFFTSMKLYYAEWPNKTISIVHAKNNTEAFWLLDQEGDPGSAKVWSTMDACAITTSKKGQGLEIDRDPDCLWARVLMPGFSKALEKFMGHADEEGEE